MQLKAIADQTIIITGATSGIGLATAMAASAAGARVVLAARDEMALYIGSQRNPHAMATILS
jgi:NADP-dependent 3-hydroxy acid dehydrogenase YdfG